MPNSEIVTQSDRELLESIASRLDHHDGKLHDLEIRLVGIANLLDELAPYARRAAKLLTDNPAARWARRNGKTP